MVTAGFESHEDSNGNRNQLFRDGFERECTSRCPEDDDGWTGENGIFIGTHCPNVYYCLTHCCQLFTNIKNISNNFPDNTRIISHQLQLLHMYIETIPPGEHRFSCSQFHNHRNSDKGHLVPQQDSSRHVQWSFNLLALPNLRKSRGQERTEHNT